MAIGMNYEKAWLNYQRLQDADFIEYVHTINYTDENVVIRRSIEEAKIAIYELFGIQAQFQRKDASELLRSEGILLFIGADQSLGNEGYSMYYKEKAFIIKATSAVGILYGVFSLFRKLNCRITGKALEEVCTPSTPLRMMNHWDNMDGTIERGYAGSSFFFRDKKVLVDERTIAYARMLASVGLNGLVINNVNVREEATLLITSEFIHELRQMGEIFNSYGIKLYLSANFAAPMELKELDTADPLDESVQSWWNKQVGKFFESIPGFGGFLIKADSEGRPGPFTYGRTHADGANMLANACQPYGGIIIWRCFVYNCQQDWRDIKTDRARASYDHFKPLDGQFLDNVILQIKNGPMDFQVREPVSPLLGAMPHTNQMLEVQLAQEYTGQQRHVCFLIPMIKEILEFQTYCKNRNHQIKDIIAGKTFGNANCGIAAVANTGDDVNWTGHDLAAANLYGFGRLSFSTSLSAEEIALEWITMTFGRKEKVMKSIRKILMMSWLTYEKYTSPLGIGWMVNPSHHYGPNVEGYEYSPWGTYHRADHQAIGVDRTSKGTAYVEQYFEPNASLYESTQTCPEELLLFFHRISYDYVLNTKKSLIQHIYDSHFEGVTEVEEMQKAWESLQDELEEGVYQRVLQRLLHQEEHAKEWRDVICSYFYRKTGIPDIHKREIY